MCVCVAERSPAWCCPSDEMDQSARASAHATAKAGGKHRALATPCLTTMPPMARCVPYVGLKSDGARCMGSGLRLQRLGGICSTCAQQHPSDALFFSRERRRKLDYKVSIATECTRRRIVVPSLALGQKGGRRPSH